MSLETDLFKNLRPNYDTLVPFGFKKRKNDYILNKKLMDGQFQAEVIVNNNGTVQGKVIDLDLGEEYVLIRTRTRNEFASQVRGEYLELLEDIARSCFISVPFSSNQANWLVDYVLQTYGDTPDNPFKKLPTASVFRNHENKKWYGLIMEVERGKLEHSDNEELVEVLNVKVDGDNLDVYLCTSGIYPAYHMNKKNWISIILDEVPDHFLKKVIEESHKYTITRSPDLSPNDWLLPANPKYFDVLGAFKSQKVHTWPTRKKMSKGDNVYVYYAAPYSSIVMKAKVIDVIEGHGNVLELVKFYDKNKFPLSALKKNGCNTVRFVTKIPFKLKHYLESND